MSIDIFFASAHFLYQISIFQSSFWFFVLCYSFVKGPPSLVSAICSQRTAVLVYLFYTQAAVLVTRFVYKGPRPCLSLFICKGRSLSLSFTIHLQMTALSLSFGYSFSNNFCPCLVLFTCKGPRPCPLLFICKRLQSLSSGIHLQRTAVLVLCYSFAKDCVLVLCH